METIKRKLKMLASIAPDRGFEARTRFAIVSTPARRSVFSLPSFQPTWIRGLGLGVAGLLIAKRHGRFVPLTEAPRLDGQPVYELEYSPGIRVREVRVRAIDERRDLTIAEEAQVLEALRDAVPTVPGTL
jgi:hypothetical protein